MPLEVDICELMTEQTALVKALLNKYVKLDAGGYGSIECTDDFLCGPGRAKRLVHFKSSLALLQEFKTIHSRFLEAQDRRFISATCIHEMRDACESIAAAELAVLKMTLDEKSFNTILIENITAHSWFISVKIHYRMAEEEFPTYRLLQPELMSTDELITILRKYNVELDWKKAENCELVEIYRRVALPLPQRTYGSSWRERLLAKKQNRRKISLTDESKESSYTVKRNTSTSSTPSAPSRPTHDRLKPPLDPSSAGKEKKIIKLSSSSVSPSTSKTESQVRNSEGTKEETKDKPEPSTKRKRITIDFSDTSEKSTPLPKVVSSKRPSDEKSPRQPASKHRRIVI